MKSQRLTAHSRYEIIDNAIKDKFGEKSSKLAVIENALAVDIWSEVHKDHLNAMNKMPEYAFRFTSEIPISGNYHIILHLGKRIKLKEFYGKLSEIYAKACEEKYHDRIMEYKKEKLRLKDEIYLFKGEMETLLYHVRTTKQLVEMLPEASAWIVEHKCTDISAADIAQGIRKSLKKEKKK